MIQLNEGQQIAHDRLAELILGALRAKHRDGPGAVVAVAAGQGTGKTTLIKSVCVTVARHVKEEQAKREASRQADPAATELYERLKARAQAQERAQPKEADPTCPWSGVASEIHMRPKRKTKTEMKAEKKAEAEARELDEVLAFTVDFEEEDFFQ